MKANFLVLAAALCAFSSLFAQAPAILWQNTIGGDGSDFFFSLQQTADGGYILGGYSDSDIFDDKTENSLGGWDYWVVKLNSTGAIQWQNTIGGNNNDELRSLHQTADGGYILGGGSRSDISGDKTENPIGGSDYWVVKLNATGVIQWQNTIGGNSSDELYSIQQTADGGYILGGYSHSNISGDKTENSSGITDYWVVKLNTTGAIEWQNTIGGNTWDFLNSLHQTADGGYILGGYSDSNISGDKTENSNGGYDYWIVRLDSNGAIEWQNAIGGNGTDYLWSLQQTADGGYILGGGSDSDISGDKTENSIGERDYWVVKLNAVGAIQWQNTIGGNYNDIPSSLRQTADSGYILGGNSESNISSDKSENCLGNTDYWVVKLTPETVPTEEASAPMGLKLYPNPATDIVIVRSEAATTLCLRNAFGQILSTQTIQGEAKIDLSHYPNGIYFLVELETGIGHKIIKNR